MGPGGKKEERAENEAKGEGSINKKYTTITALSEGKKR